MQQNFTLKPITAAVIGAIYMTPAVTQAQDAPPTYEQGKGEIATIYAGEVVEKVTEVTPTNKEPGITGVRNRDGDPVTCHLVWKRR